MLTVTLENKDIVHYSTSTDKNGKVQARISPKRTGKKYYVIPVPPTCPIVTHLSRKEENRYVPNRDFFSIETEELRIFDIPPKENETGLGLSKKWKGKHILMIPYANKVEVEYQYKYILEKTTKTEKSNSIYANQTKHGQKVYCCTDEDYQLYSNNTINITNPKHNITQKKINKQKRVFVEKGTNKVVLFK